MDGRVHGVRHRVKTGTKDSPHVFLPERLTSRQVFCILCRGTRLLPTRGRLVKIKNISNSRIYLKDLRNSPQSQTEGNRGEDIYLHPNQSIYIPDTSEVLRSLYKGSIHRMKIDGKIEIQDTITLDVNQTLTMEHNFGYPITTIVLKRVDDTWVDATGIVDISHDVGFTWTKITNVIDESVTLLVKLT